MRKYTVGVWHTGRLSPPLLKSAGLAGSITPGCLGSQCVTFSFKQMFGLISLVC